MLCNKVNKGGVADPIGFWYDLMGVCVHEHVAGGYCSVYRMEGINRKLEELGSQTQVIIL